jgi:protein-disulfide isomerase/uncharacterized membrane protein
MSNQRTLTTNGLTLQHTLYLIVSLAMVGISIYLTKHYFEAYFPQGLKATGSLCDINAFWNCDNATKSIAGSIFYVPTAWFGLVIGVIGIGGAIFPSMAMEKTNKALIYLNFFGCCVLFAFSLIWLGGLCPMCTVYYALSGVAAFLFWKYSDVQPIPEVKPTLIWTAFLLVGSFVLRSEFLDQMSKQDSLSAQYIEQFFKIPVSGDPLDDSKFRIHSATDNFKEAPLRISFFSDFECPFCKVAAESMPDIIREFPDQLNIQYFFWPLDHNCNPEIKRPFHTFACAGAYVAACDPSKFAEVHDAIFAKQENLSIDAIAAVEKKYGLSGCAQNETVKADVLATIKAGEQYKINSTPTVIINGRKVKAALPSNHLIAILREILKREGK